MHPSLLSPRRLATAFGLGVVLLSGAAGATSPPRTFCDIHTVGPAAYLDDSLGATPVPANITSFFAESGRPPLPPVRLLDVSADPPREVPLRAVPREPNYEFSYPSFALLLPGSAGGQPDGTRSLLEPGHDYRFEYVKTCYEGEGDAQRQISAVNLAQVFRAMPASPPPTSAGEFAEVGRRLEPRGDGTGDDYLLDFSFTPASDLLPWGYAYYGSVSIDGAEVGGPGLPYERSIGADLAGPRGRDGRSSTESVTISCQYDSKVDSAFERHTVQYVVSPIGFEGTTLVTNTVEVALECPGRGGVGGTGGAGGGAVQGAGPLTVNGGDVASEGGGCAYAPARGHVGAWAAMVGLVAPAAFVARRRRRSNRR
ncbi:MAG TPA: hypothetical protein VFS43_41760 [Polyangiaceae bacterium]|nr:hypothetical protein [Polyangiaceae bacterium]